MITKGYFFLFLIATICCDPLSEPPHRDGSDEGSQYMYLDTKLTKLIHYYHQIILLILSSGLLCTVFTTEAFYNQTYKEKKKFYNNLFSDTPGSHFPK